MQLLPMQLDGLSLADVERQWLLTLRVLFFLNFEIERQVSSALFLPSFDARAHILFLPGFTKELCLSIQTEFHN